eukprot:m.302901 g.302901  ORF g.302901 m.302901 type:complete len:100 (-) comp16314_c3_seq2:264-563(-)
MPRMGNSSTDVTIEVWRVEQRWISGCRNRQSTSASRLAHSSRPDCIDQKSFWTFHLRDSGGGGGGGDGDIERDEFSRRPSTEGEARKKEDGTRNALPET